MFARIGQTCTSTGRYRAYYDAITGLIDNGAVVLKYEQPQLASAERRSQALIEALLALLVFSRFTSYLELTHTSISGPALCYQCCLL